MNPVWGRAESQGWPSSRPVYTIAALVVALVSASLVGFYCYSKVWTPLERLYLTRYLRTGLLARLGVKTGSYQLLHVVNRKVSRMALDGEVVPVTTASGESTFALSEKAVKQGAMRLEWQRAQYDNAKLHAFLGEFIYHDRAPLTLVKWSFCP